jgi:hypothetical protein
VSKPLRDPSTMMRLQTAATNIVQTAASRSQDHSCLGSLPDPSLNIIGCARLVSLVGPVVFIRCWFKKSERTTVRAIAPSLPAVPRPSATADCRIDLTTPPVMG